MGVMSDQTTPGLLTVAMTDVQMLAEALDDGGSDASWWFHPVSGDARESGDWSDGFDDDELQDQGWVVVHPSRGRAAFDDMTTFTQAVGDVRARDVLLVALEGKGAFRRFRDALRTFPELRDQWHVWSDARSEARAIRWLLDEGHVADADADAALVERRRAAQAALDEVGGGRLAAYDLAAAPTHWPEIVASLERGEAVTLTRDGDVFALISIYEPPM
jgi:hypothetical protein